MIGSYVDLGNPVSDHPLNRGLLAWWQPLPNDLGGNRLFDLLGRRHGVLTNGGQWTMGANGLPALKMDGVDSCVVVANDSALQMSDNFTLSAAIRTVSTSNQAIYTKGTNAYEFDLVNFSTQIRLNRDNTSVIATATYSGVGRWRYVTVTKSGSDHTIYVDGTATATSSGTGIDGSVTRDLVIGGDDATGANPFGGDLADLRIYNVALTASAARNLYSQWRRGHPDTLRRWSRKAWLFGQPATAATRANFLTLLDVA